MTGGLRRGPAGRITGAAVRSVIADAQRQGYSPLEGAPSVVGIYADPTGVATLGEVRVDAEPVTLLPAASGLEALDRLRSAPTGAWSALVTDRTEDDLGVGVLSVLVGGVLRTPDLWETVRTDFAATGLDPALYDVPDSLAVALGLLQTTPESGWPVVPGGALTRDHALGAVARTHLDLPERTVDLPGLLAWSLTPGLTDAIAGLRQTGTQALADAVLSWLADQAGDPRLAALIRRILLDGTPELLLPVGLVLDVLAARPDRAGGSIGADLDRLSTVLAVGGVPSHLLSRWADAALEELDRLLGLPDGSRAGDALRAAEALLNRVGATDAAARSTVLPSGFLRRQHAAAAAVAAATAVPGGYEGTPAERRARAAAGLSTVEDAWARVRAHRLADVDETRAPAVRHLPVLEAAVRLVRWLAAPPAEPGGLAGLALRHAREGAWVDAAVAVAHRGVRDPQIAEALDAALDAARTLRDAQNRAFAEALAAQTPHDLPSARSYGDAPDSVGLMERTLVDAVVPLAHHTPVLVLLLDGMSAAVATGLVDAVRGAEGAGWDEALLPGLTHRHAALAALPTLTEVSRTAFFTGRVQRGGQSEERSGFAALMDAAGLHRAPLFHKRDLQEAPDARAFSTQVAHALADVTGAPVVGAVLNTIDDALDKADPGGTDWSPATIRHLQDLLDAARDAGRAVVLTADHGHVVERRTGRMVSVPGASSARSRGTTPPPGEDEVLVRGVRVANGEAVLPSVERLRYTSMKAGYHGGATPAEVVVPVAVLVPDSAAHVFDPHHPAGLRVAPPQHPSWWTGAAADLPASLPQPSAPAATAAPVAAERTAPTGPPAPPVPETEPPAPTAGAAPAVTPAAAGPGLQERPVRGLGAAVVGSEVYGNQRAGAGTILLRDDAVAAAVDALAADPAHRLPLTDLAALLGVPRAMTGGAVAQLTMLLNVEGYPVLSTAPGAVRLDPVLLGEQFELD